MKVTNEVILNAVDGSVNQTSPAVNLMFDTGYSIQTAITGTLSGTLKLQGSCDAGNQNTGQPPSGVVTWTDINNSSQAVSGAGSIVYNFSDSYYKWVRLVYTASSGTGTLTSTINVKGF